MSEYIAHARKDEKSGKWVVHTLYEHLYGVAKRAGIFAEIFGSADWAEVSALWHDLGKYLPAWQAYIRRETGCDEDAHIEGRENRPNHSTAGAVLSFERFSKSPAGKILAYLIAGHHAGLPDWYPDTAGGDLYNRTHDMVRDSLKIEELETIKVIDQTLPFVSASLPQSAPLCCKTPHDAWKNQEYLHVWIRMLFSCLVDADFLDTEAFMMSETALKRGQYPSLYDLASRFDAYMRQKQKDAQPNLINTLRAEILQKCYAKASLSPGFFSLTVPTGGGKTLSSMAFALHHAVQHKKQRVIMAIPYTSIIEQTAVVYREVFGDLAVLEHHSNLDPEKEDHLSRLAAENWDAPIVVTTNVQLFESLFASRTSTCRKVHNIANSVIILDEAQMLPPEYLKPILSSLEGLVKHFGVTVILCTATQPVLIGKIGSGQAAFEGLQQVTEIVDDPENYFKSLKRVDVALPDGTQSFEWQEIADELQAYRQVLCIVNTRDDCRRLHRLMPEETVHLSANMCGQDRTEIIATVKKKLKRDEPVCVISTQLIEAGVDIDFPVVYRALAGMDSIAQAAGRCNREGKLAASGMKGKVIVFMPPKSAPVGLLRKGEDTTKNLLGNESIAEITPEIFKHYFAHFYAAVNDFDKPKFSERLVNNVADCKFQFRTFAQNFRLIDDTAQRSIVVWYENSNSLHLIELLRRKGPEPWLLRKLQRFIVNVRLPLFNDLLNGDYLEDIHGYWVQKSHGLYKPGLGLLPDTADWDNDIFMQ